MKKVDFLTPKGPSKAPKAVKSLAPPNLPGGPSPQTPLPGAWRPWIATSIALKARFPSSAAPHWGASACWTLLGFSIFSGNPPARDPHWPPACRRTILTSDFPRLFSRFFSHFFVFLVSLGDFFGLLVPLLVAFLDPLDDFYRFFCLPGSIFVDF